MNRRNLLKGILGLGAAAALEEPVKRFWPGWSSRESGVMTPEGYEEVVFNCGPTIGQPEKLYRAQLRREMARAMKDLDECIIEGAFFQPADAIFVSDAMQERMILDFADHLSPTHTPFINALKKPNPNIATITRWGEAEVYDALGKVIGNEAQPTNFLQGDYRWTLGGDGTEGDPA